MSIPKGTAQLVILCCCIILTYGCAKHKETVGPAPSEPYQFPDTPDQLMANFVEAYSGMDYQGYADVLHKDFRFVFQECDVDKLDLDSNLLGKEQELEVAVNMFSREPVQKDDGSVIAAIEDIRFLDFHPLGSWETTNELAQYPNAVRRTYQVRVEFIRPSDTNILVEGQSVYYVTCKETDCGANELRPYHQLIGWVDLTEGCEVKDE